MSLIAIAIAAISSHANASTIELISPESTFMNGQPVSARVTFTTGTDSIMVLLENLLINPTSVVQNISGLRFTVDTGQSDGTLVSSLGVPRAVASDRTYTDGPAGDTGWELGAVGDALYLHVLGTDAGPSSTLIGPPDELGVYSNSNGSIEDNRPHNSFIGETASFVLNVPGVTESSSITEATFEFNTSPGTNVTIPEPATMALLGFAALTMLRRRRS